MIRRASLRTRLAVLYAGLAVIVLAISLLTVYVVARRDALNRVDSSLRRTRTSWDRARKRPSRAAARSPTNRS